jgi:hypothetical protein
MRGSFGGSVSPNLVGIAVGVGVSLVIAGGVVQAAGTPAKCAAAKQKATGKKAAAKLACYEKAGAKAVPVDPTCLLKADQAFEKAFTKAETAGGCAVTGDAGGQENAANAFVAAMAARDSTTPCTTEGDSCGTTCGGSGVCLFHCTGDPANSPLVCADSSSIPVTITAITDVGCQTVLPGGIMVENALAACTFDLSSGRAACSLPCP